MKNILCKYGKHDAEAKVRVQVKASMLFSSYIEDFEICQCRRCGEWLVPPGLYEAIIEAYGLHEMIELSGLIKAGASQEAIEGYIDDKIKAR